MKNSLLLLASFFLLAHCGPTKNQPNIEVIQDMMEQPNLKAQDFHPYDREKSSMLVPPEGSWPKNIKPYIYKGQPIVAGEKLHNPYVSDRSEDLLKLGERQYKNYCLVCHGPAGGGDGPVAEKFIGVKPPSLVSDKVKNYPDGQIFHVITDGQGIMGTYINQVPAEKDRWAIVNYIRTLQKK